MHEMSIAQSILEIVDETLAKQNNGKLQEVVVQIGELVAVVPDSLEFCYEALVKDTKYESSKIIINVLPIKANCKKCDNRFEIKNMLFICPQCESTNIQVTQGQELKISHLEVE